MPAKAVGGGSMARMVGERVEIAGRDTSDMGLTQDIYNAGNICHRNCRIINIIRYLDKHHATGRFDLS
jgi:hypothetical protein